jgi:expansin (peptidoglycan-binding protein)
VGVDEWVGREGDRNRYTQNQNLSEGKTYRDHKVIKTICVGGFHFKIKSGMSYHWV